MGSPQEGWGPRKRDDTAVNIDHVVTDDPHLLEALYAKDEAGASSQSLAEFAVNDLNLQPPKHLPGGHLPSITMRWHAGADLEERGVPIWALDLPETDTDDDYDESGSSWDIAGEGMDWRAEEPTPRPSRLSRVWPVAGVALLEVERSKNRFHEVPVRRRVGAVQGNGIRQ